MSAKASPLGSTPRALVQAAKKAVELSMGAKYTFATLADRVRRRMEEQDGTPWNCVVARDFAVNLRYAKCAAILCTIDSANIKVLVFKSARDEENKSAPETAEHKPASRSSPFIKFRITQSNISSEDEEQQLLQLVEQNFNSAGGYDASTSLTSMKEELVKLFPGTWQVVVSEQGEVSASAPSVRLLGLRSKAYSVTVWQSAENSFYKPSIASNLPNIRLRTVLMSLGVVFFIAHVYIRMITNECCVEPQEDKPLPDKCQDVVCSDEERQQTIAHVWWSKNLMFAMVIVLGLGVVMKFTDKKEQRRQKNAA